jgi:hypothetical protein
MSHPSKSCESHLRAACSRVLPGHMQRQLMPSRAAGRDCSACGTRQPRPSSDHSLYSSTGSTGAPLAMPLCTQAYVSRTEYPEWAIPCLKLFDIEDGMTAYDLAPCQVGAAACTCTCTCTPGPHDHVTECLVRHLARWDQWRIRAYGAMCRSMRIVCATQGEAGSVQAGDATVARRA